MSHHRNSISLHEKKREEVFFNLIIEAEIPERDPRVWVCLSHAEHAEPVTIYLVLLRFPPIFW